LATLAKMTAALLTPVVIASLAFMAWRAHRSAGGVVRHVAAAAALALAIAGWWYVRNWIELGKPFVGGWDWKAVNQIWWQDPGYRTIAQFDRFGRALVRPAFAAVDGFWDAAYSSMWTDGLLSGCLFVPPWNTGFMSACSWFALPITIAMAIGAICPVHPSIRCARFVCSASLLLFLVAMLALFLRLPTYSTAKATYMLGLLPCFGLLAAIGCVPIQRNVYTRALVYGWISCSCLCAYFAYFVI
jgi:hypothetical protein